VPIGRRSSPHRRSSWIRFSERLDELAAFAGNLVLADGREVVTRWRHSFERARRSWRRTSNRSDRRALGGWS